MRKLGKCRIYRQRIMQERSQTKLGMMYVFVRACVRVYFSIYLRLYLSILVRLYSCVCIHTFMCAYDVAQAQDPS